MDVAKITESIRKRIRKVDTPRRTAGEALLATPSLRCQMQHFFRDNPFLTELVVPTAVQLCVEVVVRPEAFRCKKVVRDKLRLFMVQLRDRAAHASDVNVRRWSDVSADLLEDSERCDVALDVVEAFVDDNPVAVQCLEMALEYAQSECLRTGITLERL